MENFDQTRGADDEAGKTYSYQARPYASEVADDILSNVNTEFDLCDWSASDDAEQAELLRELITIIASYKYERALSSLENSAERLSRVEAVLQTAIEGWAVKEGYPA